MSTKTKEASVPVVTDVHPAAGMFPLVTTGPAFDALRADIKERGQREPILVTSDGRVIDGRHRLAACEAEGIEPKLQVFDGDDDAIYSLVISTNALRRDLTEAQKATAAAKYANLKRGTKKGDGKDVTQEEAAKRFGVSERAVRYVVGVQTAEADDVVDLLRDGFVSIATGVKLAKLTEAKRKTFGEELRAGSKGVTQRIAAAYAKATEKETAKKRDDADAKRVKALEHGGANTVTVTPNDDRLPTPWAKVVETLKIIKALKDADKLPDFATEVTRKQVMDALHAAVAAASQVAPLAGEDDAAEQREEEAA